MLEFYFNIAIVLLVVPHVLQTLSHWDISPLRALYHYRQIWGMWNQAYSLYMPWSDYSMLKTSVCSWYFYQSFLNILSYLILFLLINKEVLILYLNTNICIIHLRFLQLRYDHLCSDIGQALPLSTVDYTITIHACQGQICYFTLNSVTDYGRALQLPVPYMY